MSTPDLSAQIDDVLLAFENAASSTRVPEMEPFLPPKGDPARAEAVRELARVAMELRWTRGERPDPHDYLDRFPELTKPSALAALVFEDYRQRLLAGELPSRESYRRSYGVDVSEWPGADDDTAHLEPTSFTTPIAVADTPTERMRSRGSRSEPRSNRFESRMPSPGDVFAGFRIVSELGRGAFGRVFLAEEIELADRRVALKVSPRLAAEVRTLARLQHTNIVPEYSAHRAPPLTAICMPFFGRTTLAAVAFDLIGKKPTSGKLLADVVRKRQEGLTSPTQPAMGTMACLQSMSFVEAVLWIGERLADALAHAHERGIIHRDIKPANVLIADDGQPMLLDFNLASDNNEAAAERARVGGTLPYMALEQMNAFAGQGSRIDGRADIYSLGAVLYQLLTQRLPYPDHHGETEVVLERMRADREGSPPLLRNFNSDVTRAVESIIRKCLEQDRDRRYPSAAALRDDIARHRANLPLRTAPEPSLRERAQKWMRRNPRLVSPAALTGYVAAVLFLVAAITVRLSLSERFRELIDGITATNELGRQ